MSIIARIQVSLTTIEHSFHFHGSVFKAHITSCFYQVFSDSVNIVFQKTYMKIQVNSNLTQIGIYSSLEFWERSHTYLQVVSYKLSRYQNRSYIYVLIFVCTLLNITSTVHMFLCFFFINCSDTLSIIMKLNVSTDYHFKAVIHCIPHELLPFEYWQFCYSIWLSVLENGLIIYTIMQNVDFMQCFNIYYLC